VLLLIGASMSLPVPEEPPLSARARVVAAVALATFLLCFMPRPVEIENVPVPGLSAP
jgi:hypothetical protein